MDLNELMGQLQSDLTRMVKESCQCSSDSHGALGCLPSSHRLGRALDSRLNGDPCGIVCLFPAVSEQRGLPNSAVLLDLLVGFSEKINGYCAVHWRSFSKQNYFDEHGTFASALFSGPLLLIGFAQLINFLRLTSSALISAKRLELQAKGKGKTKKGKKVD